MAWYRTGSITLTNNSDQVIGSGTAWITQVRPADVLLVGGSLYEIESVESDTNLTLIANYSGSTTAGLSYAIVPTGLMPAELSRNLSALQQKYLLSISQLLSWQTSLDETVALTNPATGVTANVVPLRLLSWSTGTVWRDGIGVPSNDLGANGDYYLDNNTGNVYHKASWAYSVIGNIRGPQGSVWRNGNGVPSNSLGVDDDYYLDVSTGDVYQRASGTYIEVFNLFGASVAHNSTTGIQGGAEGDRQHLTTAEKASLTGVPQNSQSANYTLVLSDAGKHILHPSADTAGRTITIPPNSSVAYPIGTAVTFINQNAAGVLTIAITTDTMRLAGAGTTGSRTLAANGIATAIKIASTEWIISGVGLT